MAYDDVVVGAGPAGLATAIRLKQLNAALSVLVLKGGSEPGAHIISGAVMDPRAMTELFPDWKARGAPLHQPVTGDEVLFLDAKQARKTPGWLVPGCFHNDCNYVVSLGATCKWLAEQAEALGVEIFPGFAAAEVLYDLCPQYLVNRSLATPFFRRLYVRLWPAAAHYRAQPSSRCTSDCGQSALVTIRFVWVVNGCSGPDANTGIRPP